MLDEAVFLKNLVFAALSLLGACLIPSVANRYISWKQKKKVRKEYRKVKSLAWYALSIAAVVLSVFLSIVYLEVWEGVFVVIFSAFAVFGIIVDTCIRIIGNEMLLCMFPFGIAYRLMTASTLKGAFVGSLIAVVLMLIFFLAAHLIVYLHKGVRGVGMGDVKLSVVIAITLGVGLFADFILGMAVGMIAYLVFRILKSPFFIRTIFDSDNTFPMCPPIMLGFMYALFASHVDVLVEMKNMLFLNFR